MSDAVTLEGADRVESTLHDAAKDIGDLTTPNREVAQLIAAATRPPVLTGRLAGSIRATATADEAVVSSGLIYAPVIEYGWARHNIAPAKFLAEAVAQTQTQAVEIYTAFGSHVLEGVQGA